MVEREVVIIALVFIALYSFMQIGSLLALYLLSKDKEENPKAVRYYRQVNGLATGLTLVSLYCVYIYCDEIVEVNLHPLISPVMIVLLFIVVVAMLIKQAKVLEIFSIAIVMLVLILGIPTF